MPRKNKIVYILGAGFSKPAGNPPATEIDNKFINTHLIKVHIVG